MPRKNKNARRASQRRSQLIREMEKAQNQNKKKKPEKKGAAPKNSQDKKRSFRAKGKEGPRDNKSLLKRIPKNQELVVGRLDINPNGFAFIIPDNPEVPHIYIPQGDFREFMNRDKVEAKITKSYPDGKVAGNLVSVVKHQQINIIGLVRIFAGGTWVIPYDARDRHLTFEITAQAKGVELVNNQPVLCKILEYPSKARGKVEVLENIDDVEKAHNDTLRVLLQTGWPTRFSDQAVKEAEHVAQHWEKSFSKNLEDLTHLPFVTIDGADARDFDDAVYAKKTGSLIELWIAVADVSRFVEISSKLDEEAYAKSTSVYFPDHVVPMLPEVLSNGMCSLNPNELRPALVCKALIDTEGNTKDFSFHEGLIRSKKRMTYEEMQDWLESKSLTDYPKELSDSFTLLHECTEIFLKRRKRNGSLDLDIPEAKVFLNKDGTVEDIQSRQRLYAHKLIEECMLCANRAAATFLHRREACLFRVHEKPSPKKLEELKSFLPLVGVIPPEKLEDAPDFSKLLEEIKKNPKLNDAQRKAVNGQILRSLAQARYAHEPLGHFALNEIDYAHFTSPIRRYPDLVVHRMIRAHLEKRPVPHKDELALIGRHTSDCERQSIDMERKLIDIKKCRYVEKHLGEVFKCFVTGVSEKGIFAQIEDHFVDGLLDSELLSKKNHYFDGAMSYRGPHHKEISFGHELLLRLDRVDVTMGRIYYGWGDEAS